MISRVDRPGTARATAIERETLGHARDGQQHERSHHDRRPVQNPMPQARSGRVWKDLVGETEEDRGKERSRER